MIKVRPRFALRRPHAIFSALALISALGAGRAAASVAVQLAVPSTVEAQEAPTSASAGTTIPLVLTDSATGTPVSPVGYLFGCTTWSVSYLGHNPLHLATSSGSGAQICPAGMSYSAAQGGFLWRPTSNMAGTWNITFAVRSLSGQLLSTATSLVTVNNLNVAPTAGQVTCTSSSGAVTAVRAGIDDSIPDLTCSVSGFMDQDVDTVGDSPSVTLASPSATGCPTDGSLSFVNNEDGTATISGAIPSSVTKSCIVSVVTSDKSGAKVIGAAPRTLSISPITLKITGPSSVSGTAGQSVTFPSGLAVSDASNAAVSFSAPTVALSCASYSISGSARVIGCPPGLSVDQDGAISWTPTTLQTGSYNILFSARTPTGRSASFSTTVALAAPPVPAFVTSVSSTSANGTYNGGAKVAIDIAFSKVVLLSAPQSAQVALALDSSLAPRTASYVSGSGSTTLRFSYIVQPGDNAAKLDLAGSPIELTGGTTLADTKGLAASLSVPSGAAATSLATLKAFAILAGNTPVTVSIDSPAAEPAPIVNLANAAAFAVSGSCSEPGQNVTLTGPTGMPMVTAACEQAGTWSASLRLNSTSIPQGVATIKAALTAKDRRVAVPATLAVQVFTTVPRVSITAPATLASITAGTAASFTVSGTCSAAGGTVHITGAASIDTSCSSDHTFSASLNFLDALLGSVTITAQLTDLGGNASVGSSKTYQLKSLPPAPILTSSLAGVGASGYVNFGSLQSSGSVVSVSVTPEDATLSWSIVKGTQGCSSLVAADYGSQLPTGAAFASLPDDTYKVCIRATNAGRSAFSESPSIVLKKTKPAIASLQLDGAATGGYVNATQRAAGGPIASIQASSYDKLSYAIVKAPADCEAATYQAEWLSAPSASELTGQDEGGYVVCARATDNAGNDPAFSSTPAFVLDTLAPTTPSAPTAPGAVVRSSEVSLSWAQSNDGAGSGVDHYDLEIGTSPGASDVYSGSISTPSHALTGTHGATYHARLRSVDQAGNASAFSPEASVRVNLATLTVTMSPPDASVKTGTTLTCDTSLSLGQTVSGSTYRWESSVFPADGFAVIDNASAQTFVPGIAQSGLYVRCAATVVDQTGDSYEAGTSDSSSVYSTLSTLAGLTPSASAAAITFSPGKTVTGVVGDSLGNTYVASGSDNRIYKITANGMASLYAGASLTARDMGDGHRLRTGFPGLACLAIDNADNLYTCENGGVRKIDAASGMVTTVAGMGATSGIIAENSNALAVQFTANSVAVDNDGNIYFSANSPVSRIYKVSGGVITTLAGSTNGFSGDGFNASLAQLNFINRIAIDKTRKLLYIADNNNYRIRMVDLQTKIISTVVGTGTVGTTGDDGPATSARTGLPYGLAVDETTGDFYIADQSFRIRKVTKATGVISGYAGNGTSTLSTTEGLLAKSSPIYATNGSTTSNSMFVNGGRDLVFIERGVSRVRKVSFSDQKIYSVINKDGDVARGGEGALATEVPIHANGVAVDAAKNLYLGDSTSCVIRKVSHSTGTIENIAGVAGTCADDARSNVSAKSVSLMSSIGIPALDSSGNVYFYENFRIRKVDTSGIITTVAGTGTSGASADGSTAASSPIHTVNGLLVDSSGDIYIAESSPSKIRKIRASDGTIWTIAGTDVAGFSGDGGPATEAQLSLPYGMIKDAAGNLYFADRSNKRVRKIATDGTISTIVGSSNSSTKPVGDGLPATDEGVRTGVDSIAFDSAGNLYIAVSSTFGSIRRVDKNGIISTFAGRPDGTIGVTLDGEPTTSLLPMVITIGPDDTVYGVEDSTFVRVFN